MLTEVRIPTCNRPQYIQRALTSLVQQTHGNWRAIIFDDSANDETRLEVARFGDARILYRRNPTRLGGAKNIDQCFAPEPMVGGEVATILEDDNWFFPEHLETCLRVMLDTGLPVVHASIDVWRQSDSGPCRVGYAPFNDWWGRKSIISARDTLRRLLLTAYSVSNAALVWKLGRNVDLTIGNCCVNQWHQEHLRGVCMPGVFAFSPEPTVAVVWFGPGSNPLVAVNKSRQDNRKVNIGIVSIYRHILRIIGRQVIEEIEEFALNHGYRDRFVHALIRSLNPHRVRLHDWNCENAMLLAKTLAIISLYEDPYAEFFKRRLMGFRKELMTCDTNPTRLC
jgi:glycosyltransferase involved in cell wall biosynthesis